MTVYIPPSGARQVAPSDMDTRAARRRIARITGEKAPPEVRQHTDNCPLGGEVLARSWRAAGRVRSSKRSAS